MVVSLPRNGSAQIMFFILCLLMEPSDFCRVSAQSLDESGKISSITPSPSQGVINDSEWYDSKSGEIKPIQVKTREDDSIHRESRWLPQAQAVPKAASSAESPSGFNLDWLGEGFTYTNLFAWVVLIILIIGAGAGVAWLLGKGGVGGTSSGSNGNQTLSTDQTLLERIQELPEELRRDNLDYRAEAERMMRSGALEQAIVLLFAYQLLLLDRAACLRLHRGKTNRQYLRELRSTDQQVFQWVERVVSLFEGSYFGRRVIQQSDFSRCWKENELLEGKLARLAEVSG